MYKFGNNGLIDNNVWMWNDDLVIDKINLNLDTILLTFINLILKKIFTVIFLITIC